MFVGASKPALCVTSLRKAYQGVAAVNGIDLEVHHGECFGLFGPNGAGKTTTGEICEGFTAPDSRRRSIENYSRTRSWSITRHDDSRNASPAFG